MPVSMSGSGPRVRYGTLARLPWESPAFEEVGVSAGMEHGGPQTVWERRKDPSSRIMPAGAPSELYRGPRYQAPAVPQYQNLTTEAPPPEVTAQAGRGCVHRVRVNSTLMRAEEIFDPNRGGWVLPEGMHWENQPSAKMAIAAANRHARSIAPPPAPSNAPAGTYSGVASRVPNQKYAKGITVPPFAPPPMGVYQEPGPPTCAYSIPNAPGTSVPLRGGSWPVDQTVR